MGGYVSRPFFDAGEKLKAEAKSAMMMSKLADLKVKKAERDAQLAMRMASFRDRIHWLAAFYAALILVNGVRTKAFGMMQKQFAIGFFEPLPLVFLPYVGTPFLFLYQADFAYGTKMERLNQEAKLILRKESHWFNGPMKLPKSMEPHYHKMMAQNAEEMKALGLEPEPEWAVFSDNVTTEDLLRASNPMSRIFHNYSLL